MRRGGAHVAPSSVVRENHAGDERRTCWLASVKIYRLQIAYAKPARVGSAVMESLSWPTVGSVSNIKVVGSVQVSPPSVERTTSVPWLALEALNDKPL